VSDSVHLLQNAATLVAAAATEAPLAAALSCRHTSVQSCSVGYAHELYEARKTNQCSPSRAATCGIARCFSLAATPMLLLLLTCTLLLACMSLLLLCCLMPAVRCSPAAAVHAW